MIEFSIKNKELLFYKKDKESRIYNLFNLISKIPFL